VGVVKVYGIVGVGVDIGGVGGGIVGGLVGGGEEGLFRQQVLLLPQGSHFTSTHSTSGSLGEALH
jgi:hypothetical protein